MPMGEFVCDTCGQFVATRKHPCKPNRVTLSDASFSESNSVLRRKAIQFAGTLEKLQLDFKILLDAAKKVVEKPGKAAQIMAEAIKKIEKGDLQFDPVTRRRLEDGGRAMGLPVPKTKEEAVKYVNAMRDGAVALQSLDDLGAKTNKKAWADMTELGRRAKKVKKKFKLK